MSSDQLSARLADSTLHSFGAEPRDHPYDPLIRVIGDVGYINDAIYGDFEFDMNSPTDHALIWIARGEPMFRRLDYISQLTLPPTVQTVPEIGKFTRYEHSIGTMLLARTHGASPEQQMSALLHDIGHGAFSHLIEWVSSEIGENEEAHEENAKRIIARSEIPEILAAAGMSLEATLDDSDPDIIERPKPDLCTDRFDYGIREFARWTAPNLVGPILDSARVHRDEQQFYFTDPEVAFAFGKNFLRLAPENWYAPANMFKQNLLLEVIRYAVRRNIATLDELSRSDMEAMSTLDFAGIDLAFDRKILDAFFLLNNHMPSDVSLDVKFVERKDKAEIDETNTIVLPHGNPPFRYIDPRILKPNSNETVRLSESRHPSAADYREVIEDGRAKVERVGNSVVAATVHPPRLAQVINNLRAETSKLETWWTPRTS